MQRIVDRLAKWKMHRFLSRHPKINRHLPPTAVLTPATITSFANRYQAVYIKGNTLHTGSGIIKAWRTTHGYKYVRVRGKINLASSESDLYRRIKQVHPNELFIIQKAIDLATIDKRPYDIRVMMMRDANRKWQYAGMVAKVHGPGSVISNVRRGGGYVTTVEDALTRSNFNAAQIRQIKHQLVDLSSQIIAYSEKYPFFSYQSGIDLAVDKQGRVWVIEVNLHNPSHGLFRQLADKTAYYRIRKLYVAYLSHNKRLI